MRRRLLPVLLLCPLLVWAAEDRQLNAQKESHPAHPEDGGLRLEATANLDHILTWGPPSNQWGWGGTILTVDFAVRNISNASITLPTTAYDGQLFTPSWPSWGEGTERVALIISPPKFAGRPTTFPLSRFGVVTLAPGECALLGSHRTLIKDRKHVDALKVASVAFVVSRDFKNQTEWWKGSLQVYQDISRGVDLDREIAKRNDADARTENTGSKPEKPPPSPPSR